MRILVTGSAGFVGKELVPKLQSAGHYVIGIDINTEDQSDTFFRHDLTMPFLEKIQFDTCIHLASSVGGILFNTEKAGILEYNNLINTHTLALLSNNGCDRMIFFSSINVFEGKDDFSHAKLRGLDQKSPYALSKAISEMYFAAWMPNIVIIRPTNIFGKSQIKSHQKFGESHVIPDLMTKIENADSEIEVFGDGTQMRNFLHVDDINEFLLKILHVEGQYFLNLRSNILVSIGQLAEELIRFQQKNVTIKFLPEFMKYEQMRIQNFSIDVPENLGFTAYVDSLSDGLRK